MNKNIVFCEECRKDVAYSVIEKQMIGKVRGVDYNYIGKEAVCTNCGAFVYVEEINDFNIKALYDVYRKENGIISLEKIKQIPKRYAIGKRPLSILLGWGEHTFARYMDGEVPTRQYLDILNKLYEDPKYYLSILEENKDRLVSRHTYEKSKKAVELLINNEAKSSRKIDLVIKYLLNQCEDITPLALQKSLYYIQGFYYAFGKEFIFEDDCEAWTHGPVYRDVYIKYADYHFDPIAKVERFDSSVFSSIEKDVIDSVIKNICCYSGKVLESFTHNETPWLDTRDNLEDGLACNKIIDKQLIAAYFEKVKVQYNMNSINDIKLYTNDMFNNLENS